MCRNTRKVSRYNLSITSIYSNISFYKEPLYEVLHFRVIYKYYKHYSYYIFRKQISIDYVGNMNTLSCILYFSLPGKCVKSTTGVSL